MITQLIAIVITAVMHYYFGISLLIKLPDSEIGVIAIASLIVLASVGLFLNKIKLCPNNETGFYSMQFVELLLFFTISETSMGLLFSIRYHLNSLIGNAFPSSNGKNSANLTDFLMIGIACAILATAMLETKVVHKAAEYFTRFSNRQKCEECPKNIGLPKSREAYPEVIQQQQTVKSDMKYINPLCPCHGVANFQAKSNTGKKC
ncbi:unnamed protein product [Chironomus riparius]|uniref:Uncharacterized protein n=1 Tax=Chironomus riparius TaxID=315576 RepID=A0A9N9RKI4_9DIPT|nr:unnamed protein product [Chironomus riparius]